MGCINNVLMENVGYDHPIAQNPAKPEAHGCGGGCLGGQLLPESVWGGSLWITFRNPFAPEKWQTARLWFEFSTLSVGSVKYIV